MLKKFPLEGSKKKLRILQESETNDFDGIALPYPKSFPLYQLEFQFSSEDYPLSEHDESLTDNR
jgi:hypothetical protein